MAVSTHDLERIGVSLRPDEFERLVTEVVRRMPPARRARAASPDLDPETRALLERGGLTFAPLPDERQSPLARTAAKYAALLATAPTVAEVAGLLDVDPSWVRQRLGQRTLYGSKTARGWRLPAFQFDLDQPDRLVPGIGRVLAALPADLHPVAVYNWFTLPDPDLTWQGEPLSPLDWLRSGGDPEPAAAIAADLQRVSKFPPPPGVAALRAVPPAEHVLPAGTLLWRIYAAGGAHPARWDGFRAFGPLTTMRFDHHTPPRRLQGRAILYGATGIGTCVAEVFQATRSIVALARRLPRRYDAAVRARGDRAAWDLGPTTPRSQAFLWP